MRMECVAQCQQSAAVLDTSAEAALDLGVPSSRTAVRALPGARRRAGSWHQSQPLQGVASASPKCACSAARRHAWPTQKCTTCTRPWHPCHLGRH